MKRRDDAFLARRDSFLLGPDVSFPGEAEVSWVAEFAPSVENDPFRTLADCDASRFEDDILAAWYCYQSAKRLFLPELPGQERAPPEVRSFV
jgi:hypothetical protein